MRSPVFGEFMGTMVMVFLGNGSVANVLLKRSKAEGAGWMVITAGWGLAVMAGIFVAIACGSSDAYLNPAVTIGFAVSSHNFAKFLPYLIAEVLGAFAGSVLVWLHFYPHWKLTEDTNLTHACFCTSPAIRNYPMNLFSEIFGTLVLVFVASAILSKTVAPAGLSNGIGPYLVSMLVWGIGLSLGGTTGYAINPARDLGPRLAHFLLPIARKGPTDWRYAPVPIIGPLIGGAIAGFAVRLLNF